GRIDAGRARHRGVARDLAGARGERRAGRARALGERGQRRQVAVRRYDARQTIPARRRSARRRLERIAAHDGIDHGVVMPAEDREPAAQHALLDGADLLRDALAAAIADRGENLDALDVGVRESPFDDAPRRLRRDALPRGARPDPIAEIRDARGGIDSAQAARADEAPPGEDAELIARALVAAVERRADPFLRVVERVRRPAPVHPPADLGARLVDRAEDLGRIPHLERTHVNLAAKLDELAEDQLPPPFARPLLPRASLSGSGLRRRATSLRRRPRDAAIERSLASSATRRKPTRV